MEFIFNKIRENIKFSFLKSRNVAQQLLNLIEKVYCSVHISCQICKENVEFQYYTQHLLEHYSLMVFYFLHRMKNTSYLQNAINTAPIPKLTIRNLFLFINKLIY